MMFHSYVSWPEGTIANHAHFFLALILGPLEGDIFNVGDALPQVPWVMEGLKNTGFCGV